MAKATYWQRGESLDYKNTTDAVIPANTIVLVGNILGVIGTDIASGEVGSLHVSGVWKMPVVSASISMGSPLYWDASQSKLTTTASTNKLVGVAAADATSSDTEVFIKLNG